MTRSVSAVGIYVPHFENVHSEHCIYYRGPIIWNSLPSSIHDRSYNSYKLLFKSNLLNEQERLSEEN